MEEHPVSTSLVGFEQRNLPRSAGMPIISSTDAFWRLVLAHDRSADGAFVYGVRSTGIYCRPSCPSRRPKRDQVVFFALPEAAERQGFRECRRCKPRRTGMRDPRIETVARVCRDIEARLKGDSVGESR